MVLTYKFKKERLRNGGYAVRPRILVELTGSESSIIVPALIDSGCDTTVIPEGIAKSIGLELKGKKDKLYAFREASDVKHVSANITFLGKEYRQSVTLTIPSLIVLSKEGSKEEEDITLGVQGVFDSFEILFKKQQNKIMFKPTKKNIFFKK